MKISEFGWNLTNFSHSCSCFTTYSSLPLIPPNYHAQHVSFDPLLKYDDIIYGRPLQKPKGPAVPNSPCWQRWVKTSFIWFHGSASDLLLSISFHTCHTQENGKEKILESFQYTSRIQIYESGKLLWILDCCLT